LHQTSLPRLQRDRRFPASIVQRPRLRRVGRRRAWPCVWHGSHLRRAGSAHEAGLGGDSRSIPLPAWRRTAGEASCRWASCAASHGQQVGRAAARNVVDRFRDPRLTDVVGIDLAEMFDRRFHPDDAHELRHGVRGRRRRDASAAGAEPPMKTDPTDAASTTIRLARRFVIGASGFTANDSLSPGLGKARPGYIGRVTCRKPSSRRVF